MFEFDDLSSSYEAQPTNLEIPSAPKRVTNRHFETAPPSPKG